MNHLYHIILLISALSLIGCGGGDEDTAIPNQAPATAQSIAPVTAPAISTPPPGLGGNSASAPTLPAPGTGLAPGGNTGDPLAGFRNDETGKKRTDLEILQLLVEVSGLSSDSEGNPYTTVMSLDELVARKTIPAVPAPPAGKKWLCEKGKVSLVDAN